MNTIIPFLLVIGLPAFAHEIIPQDPPEGTWSVEIHYSVKVTGGNYIAYRGTVDSDWRFSHVAASESVKKMPLQPPRLKCTKEQAIALYASAARALNYLEIQPNPKARLERPAYLLTRLSIALGNQKLSLDTQQPPQLTIVAVIDKLREVSRSVE